MSELKRYLLKHYPNLEEASADIGVSKSTLYNYVNNYPERILEHIPRLIADGKQAVVAISEADNLLRAVIYSYLDNLYSDPE